MLVSFSTVASKIQMWDRVARPFFSFIRRESLSRMFNFCFCAKQLRNVQAKSRHGLHKLTKSHLLVFVPPKAEGKTLPSKRPLALVWQLEVLLSQQKRFLPSECSPLLRTTSSGQVRCLLSLLSFSLTL